jgi:hypothetical protein
MLALCSMHSSPGVTTCALALATAWPAGPYVVLAELDPCGGDLAIRFNLPDTTGLVSYAAASHRPGITIEQHTQRLGDVEVFVGPKGGEQATAALSTLSELTAAPDTVIIADCGRLAPGSPTLKLITDAEVIVVARPRLDELAHVRLPRGALLLVGTGAYPPKEIEQTLGRPVAGAFPVDPWSAAVLRGDRARRWWRRMPLLRAATSVAEALFAAEPVTTSAKEDVLT